MSLITTVLEEITKDGRICLQPPVWNQVWEMLAAKEGEKAPPKPLILAAWNFSSDSEKRLRLQEQMCWADSAGCLPQVFDFILNLDEKDWFYGN